jgi:hypothetical protein
MRRAISRSSVLIVTIGLRTTAIIGPICRKLASRMGFALLTGLMFITVLVMFIHSDKYWLTIFLFFLLCLSFFHFILAVHVKMSKRFVRGTDYIYFLLAFVGIVIVAIAQDQERRQSYANLVVSMEISPDLGMTVISALIPRCDKILWDKTAFEPLPSGVKNLILPDRLSPDTCELLSQAASILSNKNYSAIPQWRIAQQNKTHFLFSIGLSSFISDIILQNVGWLLDSVYYRYALDAKKELSVTSVISISFNYLSRQVWPFILVLAIALRMTRVTADVTDWPI